MGSLVDLTCFSFNPVKNLGAMGDAGAVTGQKPIIDKVKMFRDHGRRTKFEYETVGYNARIDNLQAVVIQTKLKKISVCILTPHADFECATKFVKSLVNMIAYSHMHGLNVEMIATTERMVVDWARNDLAKLVKNSKSPYTGKKYTHCLWLDEDMVFSPDTAIVLATEMADYDMMSGLYFARHKPLPVVYVRGEEDKDDPYKHYPLMRAPKRVFACDAVGFGCLLMRTDVFDKVPEPWFTIDSRGGEDIVFCKHARDAGLTIGC